MGPTFICTPAFISKLHKEYLLPLLRRWRPWFLEMDKTVDLDSYDWFERGLQPISDILRQGDKLPQDLAETLLAISEISTTEGYNTIIEMAVNSGWDLGEKPLGGWSAQDMAARAWMEQPTLFARVAATVQVRHTRNFLDYFDTECGDLEKKLTPAIRAKLERSLGEFWGDRKRARFAKLEVFKVDGRLVLMMLHAELPKTQAVIADNTHERKQLTVSLEVTDLAVFEEEIGRLSVNTRFATHAPQLRSLIGKLCWNDAGRYQELSTYTGRPLITRGSGALVVRSGAFTVRLKEAVLMDPNHKHHRMVIRAPPKPEALDRDLQAAMACGCTVVTSVTLAFNFPGRKSEVVVTIDDKNKVSLPRHLLQSQQIYWFLVDQEFALLPEPRKAAA